MKFTDAEIRAEINLLRHGDGLSSIRADDMLESLLAERQSGMEDAERWKYGSKEGFPFQWQTGDDVAWSMPGEETYYPSPEEAIDAERRGR